MYYPNKDKIFDQSVDLIFRQLADDWAGAFSEEATPVPIPNTEVKLLSGDDTGNGKVARCRILSSRPSFTRRSFCLHQFDIPLMLI